MAPMLYAQQYQVCFNMSILLSRRKARERALFQAGMPSAIPSISMKKEYQTKKITCPLINFYYIDFGRLSSESRISRRSAAEEKCNAGTIMARRGKRGRQGGSAANPPYRH